VRDQIVGAYCPRHRRAPRPCALLTALVRGENPGFEDVVAAARAFHRQTGTDVETVARVLRHRAKTISTKDLRRPRALSSLPPLLALYATDEGLDADRAMLLHELVEALDPDLDDPRWTPLATLGDLAHVRARLRNALDLTG